MGGEGGMGGGRSCQIKHSKANKSHILPAAVHWEPKKCHVRPLDAFQLIETQTGQKQNITKAWVE
jgi:hypothetical protein